MILTLLVIINSRNWLTKLGIRFANSYINWHHNRVIICGHSPTIFHTLTIALNSFFILVHFVIAIAHIFVGISDV
ncbi:hypothetical protein BpHYR1_025099 [Brachionus plicatilis]|uniref:Uncharacterized protein n=1 Tax=Brachionus plicatilis TaxID=10195 RepID=A0A3M7RGI1_BRAPC|nr:hypothetical protein BpHYR1_025099 [Brachionus plicatilis]